MEIVKLLIDQLGIDENQAKGGLGSLFSFAKENLNFDDFSKIANSIGDVNELMGAAPKAEGLGSMIGGITSALGVGEGLGGLAAVADQFKSLGLDSEMIAKFAPIVTNFIKEQSGDEIASLVSNLFSGK